MTQPKAPRLRNTQMPQTSDNLARNNPVPNLFEDFTEIISGELKSMNESDFTAENRPDYPRQDGPPYDGPPKPSLR